MKELFALPPKHESQMHYLLLSWRPDGLQLALATDINEIHIVDDHGKLVNKTVLPNNREVTALEWSQSGQALTILQEGINVIQLWDLGQQNLLTLETNHLDYPTFLSWNPITNINYFEILAIGTQKGNLLLYSHGSNELSELEKRQIPTKIVGKHAGKIQCGGWHTRTNRLILGSQDCTLTISDANGETLNAIQLNGEPLGVRFCNDVLPSILERHAESSKEILQCTINIDGQEILVWNEEGKSTEINFDDSLGSIVFHEYVKSNLILLGFKMGSLKLISVSHENTQVNKWSFQAHPRCLYEMIYSHHVEKCITSGDDGIKCFAMDEMSCVMTSNLYNMDNLQNSCINWSFCGKKLGVLSKSRLCTFLTHVPCMYATHGMRVAFLETLNQLSVLDVSNSPDLSGAVTIKVEQHPKKIFLGPNHVGCLRENEIVFYKLNKQNPSIVNKVVLINSTDLLCCLNSKYFAAVCDGKVAIDLYLIENSSKEKVIQKINPQKDKEENLHEISCIAMTDDLLILCTEEGKVYFFALNEHCFLSEFEFKHTCNVRCIFPNRLGTKVVLLDEEDKAYIFDPLGFEAIEFPDFPPNIHTVIWDQMEQHVIQVYGGSNLHTYVYAEHTIRGSILTKFGLLKIDSSGGISVAPEAFSLPTTDLVPVVNYKSQIVCISKAKGGLTALSSHVIYDANGDRRENRVSISFHINLGLNRLELAWKDALILKKSEVWLALGKKALHLMNLEIAIRVYRQLGDAGMVITLERYFHIENRNLLTGHILVLFMEHEVAQEHFLASCRPQTALEMRRDLRHWDEALKLATKLDPKQIPIISFEYAQHLELKRQYQEAQQLYENANNGLHKCTNETYLEKYKIDCMHGIARTSLRNGNLEYGIQLAKKSNNAQLCCACADILVSLHQLVEAAELYEEAKCHEKAVEMYIETKDFQCTLRLKDTITSKPLLIKYAELCEEFKEYELAVKAYQQTQNIESIIRLYLDPLNKLDEAISIVRSSESLLGASAIAKYCDESHDFEKAIEFYLFSDQKEKAFDCARKNKMMEIYIKYTGKLSEKKEALKLANYFETQNEGWRAAKYFSIARKYKKSFNLFLQSGEKYLGDAIEVVGEANDESLTHKMIDFLMGESDGHPKAPKYVYKLYMAMGNYEDAIKTAIIIAEQEQKDGNYTRSHKTIFNAIRDLETRFLPVPRNLRQMFLLFHSYQLAKTRVKQGDHEAAARLLLRVSKHANQFPQHNFSIILGTVIECHKSGLKKSAYNLATTLFTTNAFKQDIEKSKFKKKVQAIFRRPNSDEKKETMQPCPISKQMIGEMNLECPTTRDAIPFCIYTGKHMVLGDWCFCPNSGMPALYSIYKLFLEKEPKVSVRNSDNSHDECLDKISSPLDPVCQKPIQVEDLKKCTEKEALNYIKQYNTYVSMDKSEK